MGISYFRLVNFLIHHLIRWSWNLILMMFGKWTLDSFGIYTTSYAYHFLLNWNLNCQKQFNIKIVFFFSHILEHICSFLWRSCFLSTSDIPTKYTSFNKNMYLWSINDCVCILLRSHWIFFRSVFQMFNYIPQLTRRFLMLLSGTSWLLDFGVIIIFIILIN